MVDHMVLAALLVYIWICGKEHYSFTWIGSHLVSIASVAVEVLVAISRLLSSGVTSPSSIDRCEHFGGAYGYREERVGTRSITASSLRSSAFLIVSEQTDAITQTLCYMLGIRFSQQWLWWLLTSGMCCIIQRKFTSGTEMVWISEMSVNFCRLHVVCFLEVGTLHCITWFAKERK